jgi:hypothetical protein
MAFCNSFFLRFQGLDFLKSCCINSDKIKVNTHNLIWIFFNIKTQVQTRPMPHTRAHAFILQLKPTEMRQYVIWTPGWKKWIPVNEMLKSEKNFFEIPPPLTTVSDNPDEVTKTLSSHSLDDSPNREITYTVIALTGEPPLVNDEFVAESVDWEKTPAKIVLKKSSHIANEDKRSYKRFPHRLELVLMTNKGKSFRSSTLNVSLGGALLREPVPAELLKDVMDLLIVNPFPDKVTPSHLLIKGRIVGDTADRRRLMFYDVSPEVQFKLRDILEKYQGNYKDFKKNKKSA